MSVPPDVLFHRFFQQDFQTAADRQVYCGKFDLDRLDLDERKLLLEFQHGINRSRTSTVSDYRHHRSAPGPFHFDYVDSAVENALAFRYEGYSFIGVTLLLVRHILAWSSLLSKAEPLRLLIGAHVDAPEMDVCWTLFRIQMHFVIFHEFAHHAHGHVLAHAADSSFANEIVEDRQSAGTRNQVLEADADSYAACLVMRNLILGRQRSAMTLLRLADQSESVQDNALLCCFIAGIMAFFFSRGQFRLDGSGAANWTHPPSALRLNFVMNAVSFWCGIDRPTLLPSLSQERFFTIGNSVAEVIWGPEGAAQWAAQDEFLRSEVGSRYVTDLQERYAAYLRQLHEGAAQSMPTPQ